MYKYLLHKPGNLSLIPGTHLHECNDDDDDVNDNNNDDDDDEIKILNIETSDATL